MAVDQEVDKPANFFAVIKNFQLRIGKNPYTPYIFIALNLAISLFVNILANKLDLMLGTRSMIGLAAIISFLLIFLVWVVSKTPVGQLPQQLNIGRYTARCVNTPALVDAANAITAQAFGEATPPDGRVHDILRKNKKACLGLFERTKDGRDELVAYASCWPIKQETWERLRIGEGKPGGLSEKDFTAEHILSDMEIDDTEVLFVPAVAVKDPGLPRGQFRSVVLSFEWIDHIRRTYRQAAKKRPIRLFLVGATDEGRNMTKMLAGEGQESELASPAGNLMLYNESLPFYETLIKPENWEQELDRIQGHLFRAWYRLVVRE